MNEKLSELIKKNEAHINILKDEKALEAIMAIKEVFIDKFLERGDIRLLILDALGEGSKHGYQIMTSISKRFYEVYKPSPGVIYPTLQSLSEEGMITCEDNGKRKVYSINKKGEKLLRQNKKRIGEIISEFEGAYSNGNCEFAESMERIIPLWVELAYNVFFMTKHKGGGSEKRKKIEIMLKRSVKESNEIWK